MWRRPQKLDMLAVIDACKPNLAGSKARRTTVENESFTVLSSHICLRLFARMLCSQPPTSQIMTICNSLEYLAHCIPLRSASSWSAARLLPAAGPTSGEVTAWKHVEASPDLHMCSTLSTSPLQVRLWSGFSPCRSRLSDALLICALTSPFPQGVVVLARGQAAPLEACARTGSKQQLLEDLVHTSRLLFCCQLPLLVSTLCRCRE